MRTKLLVLFGCAAFTALSAPMALAIEEHVNDRQRLAQLEAAAQGGSADALYDLASLLEFGGDDVPVDLNRAIALYKQAAELGNGVAVYAVNNHLFDVTSPHHDEAEGIRLLRKQMTTDAANGHDYRRTLAYHLATTPSEQRNLAEGIRLLREGVALGDAYSIRELAAMLTPSSGDDDAANALRDPHEAIKLYEKFLALPEGESSTDDMAELARLYVDNVVEGIDNEAKANFWIQKAVADEFAALGRLYLGDFVFYGQAQQTYDFAIAKQHWLKAQELRPDWDLTDRIEMADEALAEDRTTTTADAMVALARQYDGLYDRRPMDWNKAELWYQRAVDAGTTDRDAIASLALLLDLGGSPSKAAPLWRRLATGSDEIAADARENLAAYEANLAAARTKVVSVTAKPAPKPRAATAAAKPSASKGGAPNARQIRDALVYELTYGRVTVGDALGLATREADYEAGISRVTVFGLTVEQSFVVANPTCTASGKGKYSCRYDLKMSAMGFPYVGPGSHTFELRNGIWRSPTYLEAIIEAGNRSAAGANNGKNCTVQGFGTAEGASIRDQNGLPC